MIRYSKFLFKRLRRTLIRQGVIFPQQQTHRDIAKMSQLKCNPYLEGLSVDPDRSWFQ